jgi:hypothetical protein
LWQTEGLANYPQDQARRGPEYIGLIYCEAKAREDDNLRIPPRLRCGELLRIEIRNVRDELQDLRSSEDPVAP